MICDMDKIINQDGPCIVPVPFTDLYRGKESWDRDFIRSQFGKNRFDSAWIDSVLLPGLSQLGFCLISED